jgi:hypothetical protein
LFICSTGVGTQSHSSRPNCVMGNFKIGSQELFARAEIEAHPPDLCLLSSYHYRLEPQVPG